MLDSSDNDMNVTGRAPESSDARHAHDSNLERARAAYAAGDSTLAMHLYLAAYEESRAEGPLVESEALDALREAWRLAIELKERSMAEYIFDKLEGYLNAAEAKECALQLQGLALDKLSEFGLSRADLQEAVDMFAEELSDGIHISGITGIVVPHVASSPDNEVLDVDISDAEASDAEASSDEASAAQLAIPEIIEAVNAVIEQVSSEAADAEAANDDASASPASSEAAKSKPKKSQVKAVASSGKAAAKEHARLRFADLVGFDSVIEEARSLGLGVRDDEEYRALIDVLRVQHGLEGLSAAGTVVFRTSAREDASTFMAAVVGELDLPAMRIQVQPGPQGVPLLCVTVTSDRQPRVVNRVSIESPSVLVLEDIDLWGTPLMDAASNADGEGVMFASMSRAARETMALISSAIDNPEVYVLASMSAESPDMGYLYDLMEPMSVIDIYLPDEFERRAIWNAAALEHPSVRRLDLAKLTRLSRNLSRYDIATAAREAVEDAYRQSLRARRYVPVTQELMFEHVSNFQPLDSEEYRFLEEAVVSNFRAEIASAEASGLDVLGLDGGDARGRGGR